MTEQAEYFSRIEGRVDVARLKDAFVVMVGVGSVGSLMAFELARCGVGHVVLVDGDRLEGANLPRHSLPECYVGTNKAEAMASHLVLNVPGLDVGPGPYHLDDSFDDEDVDRLIAPADLVVVATDDRGAQRRIARRALAMDIPAIVPGLYADRGGEVFVQLNPGEACFMCWDGFREEGLQLRGVSSLNADSFAVIQQALYLCLALLEPGSQHARDLARSREDPRPRQLFVIHPAATLLRAPVTRRAGCEGCAVGPSPLNPEATDRPSPSARASDLFELVASRRQRPRAAGWPFVLSGTQAPPRITAVWVNKTMALAGDRVTVSWSARDATQVFVDGNGPHPPRGELSISLRHSRAFEVTAVNPFDKTSKWTSAVQLMPPLPRHHEFHVPGFPGVNAPPPPSTHLPPMRTGMQPSTATRPTLDMRLPLLPAPPRMFAPTLPDWTRPSLDYHAAVEELL